MLRGRETPARDSERVEGDLEMAGEWDGEMERSLVGAIIT